MICSSWPVPSVVTTSAWVSPRVNSAEPWARGSTPTWQTIGRTVLVSRPSMRRPVLRMVPRTTVDFELLEHARRHRELGVVADEHAQSLRLDRRDLVLARLLDRFLIGGGERVGNAGGVQLLGDGRDFRRRRRHLHARLGACGRRAP